MSTDIHSFLINYPEEERNIEFKESMPWKEKGFKAKITKTILAMANIRDGGWIVIGKERQPDKTFKAIGMSQSDFDSYDSDYVKDFVKDYADPYVNFSVRKDEYDQKKFVLIRIQEFDEIPVICKKSYRDILHRGKIYTRSKGGKAETIEVPGQTEMREIIRMAIEKENKSFFERLSRMGLTPYIPTRPSDKELFKKQREGLL